MNIEDAQRECRSIYINGYPGQIVSGLIWLASVAMPAPRGMWFLVIGGAFIFPLTQLVLRISGRPASLSNGNPLRYLAMQVAFTIPLTIPIAAAAALHRLSWFYPAILLIVGAHYLPFITLYGMRVYAVLAGLMIASGLAIALYVPNASPNLGGWVGAAIEIGFGAAGLAFTAATARRSAQPA